MKYYYITLLIFLSSCGTTGRICFYNFNTNKYEIENAILSVINKDSFYVVPIYVYFRNNPEELYQVRFKYDSSVWKQSATCSLALISIYQGKEFRYVEDLSSGEKKRVEKRIEKEILSKTEYNYSKSE